MPMPDQERKLQGGMTVNGCRLHELLGSGGFAAVWRAHEQNLDRTVTLKFVPSQLPKARISADEMKARVQKEASLRVRLSPRLRVPNVYWLSEFESGDCPGLFGWTICSEFIEGKDLAAWIEEQLQHYVSTDADRAQLHHFLAQQEWGAASQLLRRDDYLATSVVAVLDMLIDVAEIVAEMHRRPHGICHLDIKPKNIVIKAEDQRPYVIDLGISRNLGDDGQATYGLPFCTREYASPEQIAGGVLDRRSDVFSLGATLYHVLALHPPIWRRKDAADNWVYVTAAERTRDATALPLQELHENMESRLAAVVAKAMAQNPDERHQSVEDLLQDLRACRAAEGAVPRIHALPTLAEAIKGLAQVLDVNLESQEQHIAYDSQLEVYHALRLVQSGFLRLGVEGFRLPIAGQIQQNFETQDEVELLEKIGIGLVTSALLAKYNAHVVSIDGGTTTAWVARFLVYRDLKSFMVPGQVFTNNIFGMNEVRNFRLSTQWHALGGTVRTSRNTTARSVVRNMPADVRSDIAVLGINAVYIDETGLATTGTESDEEKDIKEEFIHRATRRVIFTATPRKFGVIPNRPLKPEVDLAGLTRSGEKSVTLVTAFPHPAVARYSAEQRREREDEIRQTIHRFQTQIENLLQPANRFTLTLYGVQMVPRLWGTLRAVGNLLKEDPEEALLKSATARFEAFCKRCDDNTVIVAVLERA